MGNLVRPSIRKPSRNPVVYSIDNSYKVLLVWQPCLSIVLKIRDEEHIKNIVIYKLLPQIILL